MHLESLPVELLLYVSQLLGSRRYTGTFGTVSKRIGDVCQQELFHQLHVDLGTMTDQDIIDGIDILSRLDIRNKIRVVRVEGGSSDNNQWSPVLCNTVVNLPKVESLTFVETAHRFDRLEVPSDSLHYFHCQDLWHNLRTQGLIRFLSSCPNLVEVEINNSNAHTGPLELSDAGAFLRPSLVSILAPLPICNVVVPRATALKRISVIPATETEVSLLPNESWNTLEALFIGGVNISSAFLSALTEYGKRLRYLEIRVDTNEESWHEPLRELLRRLRLCGVGVFISTKQNWTSTAQFEDKMKLDEQLVNSLIQGSDTLLDARISVLDSRHAWHRDTPEDGWVETSFFGMRF